MRALLSRAGRCAWGWPAGVEPASADSHSAALPLSDGHPQAHTPRKWTLPAGSPLRLCPCASHPVGCGVSLHEGRGRPAHIPEPRTPCGLRCRSAGHTRSGESTTKGPGSLRNPGPWNQSLEGMRLDASLSRMQPILLMATGQGSLAGEQLPGVRIAADDPGRAHRGGLHERTQARCGQCVVEGVPVVHDVSWSLGMLSKPLVFRATKRIVNSLYSMVKPV